jgi:hypothetical protein
MNLAGQLQDAFGRRRLARVDVGKNDVTLGMPENMELRRSGWVPVFSTVR